MKTAADQIAQFVDGLGARIDDQCGRCRDVFQQGAFLVYRLDQRDSATRQRVPSPGFAEPLEQNGLISLKKDDFDIQAGGFEFIQYGRKLVELIAEITRIDAHRGAEFGDPSIGAQCLRERDQQTQW